MRKRITSRFFSALHSFMVLSGNIGIWSAFKAFVISKFHNRLTSINLKFCGRIFFFRGRSDRGALGHFYIQNYHFIEPPGSNVIEYIVDGGANIGAETIRFRYFHPNARIIAVETEQRNFEILKTNCLSDTLTTVVHAALWPHEEPLSIIERNSNVAFQVKPTRDGNIRALSIPALMSIYDLPRIDILKLDIEGAEEKLFSENTDRWIDRVNSVIFECNAQEAPTAVQSLMRHMTGSPFKAFISGENLAFIRATTGWTLVNSDLYDK